MTENYNYSSGGMSFGSVLTLVFIILKLTDVIDWSWWWVLSPIWISVAIVFVMVFVMVFVATIFT